MGWVGAGGEGNTDWGWRYGSEATHPCLLAHPLGYPHRDGRCSMESYRENLERVFVRMDQVLPDSCLLVWNMAMPLGERVTGGFLLPEASDWSTSG